MSNIDIYRPNMIYAPMMPIGVPFFWPTDSVWPEGTLLCDGSSFSATDYPKLAQIYPSLTLPDMRGVVPRGLDLGRGLDIDGATRSPGSYQSDKIGSLKVPTVATNSSSMNHNTTSPGLSKGDAGSNLSDLVLSSGTETTVKNIAGYWLCFAMEVAYDIDVDGGNAKYLGGHPYSYYATKTEVQNIQSQQNSLVGTRIWVSDPISMPTGALTITHNLGLTDILKASWDIELKCAVAQSGYSVNDYAYGWCFGTYTEGSPSTFWPYSKLPGTLNANTITMQFSGTALWMQPKTGGTGGLVSNTNFKIVARIRY